MALPPFTAAEYLGSGLTSQRARDKLVATLSQQGIRNQQVLEVMRRVPRHLFVDEALNSHAYDNTALPIGYGQTISQPYIVAKMTELLLTNGTPDTVLEIGTGCGYQTAVLACLVKHVYTVERVQRLSTQAQQTLARLEINNVTFKYGDGYLGWTTHAPYQGIITTAAPEQAPPPLLEQLALQATLIIPLGPAQHSQVLHVIRRQTQGYETQKLNKVLFVPLKQGLLH